MRALPWHSTVPTRQEHPAPTRIVSSGGPVPPEMAERRCPACQSGRITRAEHVIVSDGVVVRKDYRCAACGRVFWVRADAESNGAPE